MAITETQTTPVFERAIFKGNASEYFGIWIVNILLTIVTFGIYSSWAKVRRMRYFYANTELLGHSFDYHARGINIFLGRLIVFGLFAIVQVASIASPIASLVASVALLAVLPWLLARSLRFSMRVTSYRNVRFDFVGKAGGAFVAVILGGFVTFLSLGILAPFAARWLNRYIVNNIRYGDRPLATNVRMATLYRGWIVPAMIVVVGALVFAGIAVAYWSQAFSAVEQLKVDGDADKMKIVFVIVIVYAILIPALALFFLAGIFWRIAVRNAVLSAATLDGQHPIISDVGRLRYFWILLSNVVVSFLTLGLMRPWAHVREWRYVSGKTGLALNGDPGEIVGAMVASGSAASAELMDMEGFDFGF